MCSAGGTGEVWQQVNQFWSMLDDLRESDPAAYRKLIQRQMKEGADLSAPPEIRGCLCTQVLEPKQGLLYINICSWKRVPAPDDPSRPLPVCGGKLEKGTNESEGWYAVLDVAINPAVLQELNGDNVKMNQVYVLALSFAQQEHGIRLSQQYTVIKCCPQSSPDELHHRLGFQEWASTSKQPDTAPNNPGGQTPVGLLQLMSALRSEEQDSAANIICKPAECTKKDLIQVISTTSVEPQKPEYQLGVKTDTAGVARHLELTVELPKVFSMSECQLSISKDDVLLEVEDIYYLLLEFPKSVNEDTASAIFNKKKRKLVLKVDLL